MCRMIVESDLWSTPVLSSISHKLRGQKPNEYNMPPEKVRAFIKSHPGFAHKPIYACLVLFMVSWNMQEHWDSDLFWFGDGRICHCGSFSTTLRFV